jgi:hypothetical protein
MFDNRIDPNDPAFRDVARRLEAYADLRLSPSAVATTRMRMNVMNAAHRRAALMEADAASAAAAATIPVVATRRSQIGWRRPVAAVFAGCLTLGLLVGTVSAAAPGGPLYAARVWTEMLTLPAGTVARAEAEVGRLDQRLIEAQQASAAGDAPATEAALAAYTAILVEAANGSQGDPAALAAIEDSVAGQISLLTLMGDTVPGRARGAVEHALSSSAMVLQGLGSPGSSGSHAGGVGSGGAGASKPGSGPAAGRSAAPGQAAQPTPTPKPTKSPKPTPTSNTGTHGASPHPSPSPSPSPAAHALTVPTPSPTGHPGVGQ